MGTKRLNIFRLAKYTNLEIVLEAQIQSTGANQAKLMERYKKNRKSIQHQVLALKIVYAVMIFFTAFIPLVATVQIINGISAFSINTILFGGTFFFGIFFITQFLYLMLLGMLSISAMMTGEAFKWYETLPLSKKRLQRLGFFTVIRNLDVAIIVMIVTFPVIIGIITQNILLIFISFLISILNVVFGISLLVLIAERISRIFKGDQVTSRKSTILRIFTTFSYFIVAVSGSLIFQWAINAIGDLFVSFEAAGISNTINFILGLIPFPFAPANLLILFIDPTQFPPNLWISGLIGVGLLVALTWFLYRKAISSMRTVTISSSIEEKSEKKKKKIEDIIVELETRTSIQAYRKKDLSSASRDMQTLMFLIMPIIIPLVYSIILVFTIGTAVGSFDQSDILIFWSVLMFFQPMISVMTTTGFLNMEDGGASILAGLPILPRDQAKAKLSVLITIQTISFFIPALLFIGSPVFAGYILLFVAWYPITLIFLFTMFYLKIHLFGRMKYKYVLEEVNPKKKTLKWILMVTCEGLIYAFYLITGAILLIFLGIIPMVLIVSISSLFILAGLIIAVSRMFPKKFGKRKMISIREALREKPLLGTLILLIVYFAFLYFPSFLQLLLLPLYDILPLLGDLLLNFFYAFGFMMLLWLLVVPKSLRLPNGKEKFSSYLKTIKLITPGMPRKKRFINIILALSCTGIYYFSLWIFALLLGDFTLNPSAIFGPPQYTSYGLVFGWFLFVLMLIPGIWEEWTFRGVILTLNSRKYSNLWAIIISSVSFGLLHFTNILSGQNWISTIFQVLYATELGFLFAYIVIRTKSLIPVILMHYLVDSLGQLFAQGAIFYNDFSVILYQLIAVGVVPAFFGILLVYLITKHAFPRLYQK
jgi:membrane protease YdiL (CAAX protease family)